jgi:elongation factor Ts
MSVNTDLIKAIRYKTDLSFKDINNAIKALNSENEDEIIDYLKKQGVLKSAAKEGREASNGSIFTYTHEMRIGVMLEIKCETDFVSRGEDFQTLGKEICLHIAAYQPKFLSAEEVSNEYIETELQLAKTKLLDEGKPAEMIEKILQGKKDKMAKEVSLLSQPFLMNTEISVDEHVRQMTAKTGENIKVTKFVVFNLNA